MIKKKIKTPTSNKLEVINLKGKIERYLCSDAKVALETPCYQTVVDKSIYKNTKEKGDHIAKYKRKAFFVEFMSVLIFNEPTEDDIIRFALLINRVCESGDIYLESLTTPMYMNLHNSNNYIMCWYPLSKISYKKLKKKYDFFNHEGVIPTYELK